MQNITLDVAPAVAIPPHAAVFVNNPKLSDIRGQMQLAGFATEFSGGVLYINNTVALRRSGEGDFQLHGTVCDDYYRVRSLLYKHFAIV